MRAILWVMLASVVLFCPAVINGQPFLFVDSGSYLRAVAIGLSKTVGPHTVPGWPRIEGRASSAPETPVSEGQAGEALTTVLAETTIRGPVSFDLQPSSFETHTATPALSAHGEIGGAAGVSGRSIYYGLFAYAGYLLSDLWLVAFLQALSVAYVCYVFARHTVGVEGWRFAAVMGVLALVTPAGFMASLVMPDVFGGVGVLALTSLMVFWTRLIWVERWTLAALTAFAAVSHSATLLVLSMMAASAGAMLLVRAGLGSSASRLDAWRLARTPAAIVLSVLLLAVLAGRLYDVAVTKLVGSPPVSVPVAMAQAVQNGAGERLIKERCDDYQFAICRFAHVLPVTDTDVFLFDVDPERSGFRIAPVDVQRDIANEQFRFLALTFWHYPLDTVTGALGDFYTQLVTLGVRDLIVADNRLAFFAQRMPNRLLEPTQRSLAHRHPEVLASVSTVQWAVMLIAILGLSLSAAWALAIWPGRLRWTPSADAFALIAAGFVFNAAVCGVLAGPWERFGSRDSWLVVFAAALLALRLASSLSASRPAGAPAPPLADTAARAPSSVT